MNYIGKLYMKLFESIYTNANTARNNGIPEILVAYPHCRLTETIVIKESFSETNTTFLKGLILDIKNSTDNDFSSILEKYNIKINITDSGRLFYADYNGSCVNFYINKTLLKIIKNADSEDLQNLYIIFAALYSHEDAHVQQLSKYNFLKNYKANISSDPDKPDLEYFDQPIEAAAYGKQMGKHLKELYPEKSIYELYDIIENTDDVKYFMDIYRDPAISKDAKKKFYRALFDEIKN